MSETRPSVTLRAASAVPSSLFLSLVILLFALSIGGCGKRTGVHQNVPPTVQIMTRPRDARVPYAADFYWTGWDADGVIDHYQYTLDVPDSVGIAELNNPDFNGVAWTNTRAPGAMFVFSTPHPDTLIHDGTMVIADLFVGRHNLFVRAVDNEGAVSKVDYVEFTAENVAPKARMTLGEYGCVVTRPWFQFLGDSLVVNLGGIDPDKPGPDQNPASYEWKVFRYPPIVDFEPDANVLVYEFGRDVPWNPVPADSPSITIALPRGADLVLAVRAIDSQGAVESRFELGRNAVIISRGSFGDYGRLTISERTLGKATFPDDGETVHADVPVGMTLEFDFSAESGSSGAAITGYCVQVDPADSTGVSCTWNMNTHAAVTLTSPGGHSIVFRARDCLGQVVYAQVLLNAVPVVRDRDVLYVDDVLDRSGIAMPDAVMDDRFQSLIREAGPFTDVYQLDIFGPNDVKFSPVIPTVADLVRYKLVVWVVNGVAYNSNPALVAATACGWSRSLGLYVASGGAVWISGQRVAGAMKDDPRYSECKSFLGYGELAATPLSFTCPGFACDFLGLADGEFRTEENSKTNGLTRALPTAEAAGDLFPPVEVDSTIFRISLGGLPFCDVDFAPMVRPGLDTLYTEQAITSRSSYNRKPVAFRYADPDPVHEQGATAVTFIPLYWLKQGSAADRTGVKGMARSLFEWFRSQEAGLPR